MQSFLQYRRFREHVTRQYQRDKSKAEALANPNNSEFTSPSSSKAVNTPGVFHAPDHADARDPEKGEQSNGQAFEAQDITETPSPEKDEDEGGGYAHIRTAPTSRRASRGGEATEDMSRASTVPTKKSMGTALGTTLTGIDVRNRSTNEGGEGRVFVVGFEGESDVLNPHNWSFSTRLAAT